MGAEQQRPSGSPPHPSWSLSSLTQRIITNMVFFLCSCVPVTQIFSPLYLLIGRSVLSQPPNSRHICASDFVSLDDLGSTLFFTSENRCVMKGGSYSVAHKNTWIQQKEDIVKKANLLPSLVLHPCLKTSVSAAQTRIHDPDNISSPCTGIHPSPTSSWLRRRAVVRKASTPW